jgi:hypothetical protein
MKGEHFWPCSKLRTACHKEREDDEIMATLGANIRAPHGLHLSQLGEDMVGLQFGR